MDKDCETGKEKDCEGTSAPRTEDHHVLLETPVEKSTDEVPDPFRRRESLRRSPPGRSSSWDERRTGTICDSPGDVWKNEYDPVWNDEDNMAAKKKWKRTGNLRDSDGTGEQRPKVAEADKKIGKLKQTLTSINESIKYLAMMVNKNNTKTEIKAVTERLRKLNCQLNPDEISAILDMCKNKDEGKRERENPRAQSTVSTQTKQDATRTENSHTQTDESGPNAMAECERTNHECISSMLNKTLNEEEIYGLIDMKWPENCYNKCSQSKGSIAVDLEQKNVVLIIETNESGPKGRLQRASMGNE